MLAAAVSMPLVLSAVLPALADQGIVKPSKKHYALHDRWAIARVHQVTRVAAIPPDLACGGFWCRRDFVLMLGIGF
jgi:hypothetical protein